MSIALILNVCIPLIAGNEDCQAYIVETYDSVIPCTIDMDKHRQTRDDRYLSCGYVEERHLQDRRDGRDVGQTLDEMNQQLQ